MKKTLTWITWLSLSAVSPFALAVGLGQASVSSYLNAPLDASIPLLESSEYALDTIRIDVAEPADFAAAGLEWTPLAASVRAQVVEHQGRRQVRLSSEQTMQEPWLDLLLTVEFPGGQQFRDLTLLFDPRDYAQQQSQNQSQSRFQNQATQSQPSTVQAQTASSTQPPVSENSTANRGAGNNSAYIGSGDTLWGVAERVKPPEASVQQMMVALLEANPEAFPSGNINDMRASQTLRIPDTERILARSHLNADTAITAMNEAWRSRRNGSLQAVSLPSVDVDAVAVTASQALVANGANEPTNALAAGGSEADEPEVGLPEESVVMSDPAALEEAEGPEALTRTELTEQLRLSQTMLQQVLDERELMRAELKELRGEVASLTQALSDALSAQQAPPEPLVASMDETDRPGMVALFERYQWPLALAAIALLLALLVWLRKRREETWDDVPLAHPVVKPTVSPSAAPETKAMPDAVPVTYPIHANSDSADEPLGESRQPVSVQNEMAAEPETDTAEADTAETSTAPPLNTDEWLVDHQEQLPEQTSTHSYEKSQAAGLAEQGRQRRMGLQAVPNGGYTNVSLAPPPSSAPMSQMLAAFGAPLQEDPPSIDEPTPHASESESKASGDDGHRFIDYHPPILNSTFTSQDSPHAETPMQPSVEFDRQPYAAPLTSAKQPRRPIEEEWEIEEVAFKPRGLDNSEPSKSSK
ncbi:type IV pilus assembly protein FimV [Vreelandella neptunia]|uniref:FimV N-terminal domain-containing protein n=1 Tax=Vreelandella neptunia TaxID=115551 RepID=A0ABS9SBD9_9GAMM|nr:FimV/HubP family polar landmark protein [Halomonas neptunia]MCH4813415.1 hypothetical protein [Halomonas neptunia]